MVLSIVSSVCAVTDFIASAFNAQHAEHKKMTYVLVALLLIESVVSIWSVVICSRSVCRRRSRGVVLTHHVPTGQANMTRVNPAQMPLQQHSPQGLLCHPYSGPEAASTAPCYGNRVSCEDLPPKY
ncbi:hypothetical protein LSAT2_029895 [Lamellibrachia satsuma]|nr:hypothetical protein LSAT2_029895 [Lamellibrachia satsuma]